MFRNETQTKRKKSLPEKPLQPKKKKNSHDKRNKLLLQACFSKMAKAFVSTPTFKEIFYLNDIMEKKENFRWAPKKKDSRFDGEYK